MFLRPLFRENYCPETVTMARCIFLHLQDMMKILFTCIVSLSHFTACPLQPELGTPGHDERFPGKGRMCHSGISKEHVDRHD